MIDNFDKLYNIHQEIHDKEQLWGSNQHLLIMKLSKRTQLLHFQRFISRTFLDDLLL